MSTVTVTDSKGRGLLSRLCPCCQKFSSRLKKLNCCKCLASKSIAGSKVGILVGSKTGMIGGSKASVDEGARSGPEPPAAGKCGWLRMVLCCRCCKQRDSDSRRRSNATSRMSKKQSRSSSTAVEVSVHTLAQYTPAQYCRGSSLHVYFLYFFSVRTLFNETVPTAVAI
jgi:hypothetical protein